MMKTKLNCRDWLDRVWFVMKTKQDNNVANGIGVVYAKNNTKKLEPIKSGVVHYENHTGQWCDRSYSYGLCQKRKWTNMTDRIGCDLWWKPDKIITWLIIQVQYIMKMKLNCHDRLDQVRPVIKTRQDNDMIDCTSAVYKENNIILNN